MESPSRERDNRQGRTAVRTTFALSLVAALLGLGTAATASAAPSDSEAPVRQEINILAAHSKKCVEAVSADDGAAVRQKNCAGGERERWYVRSSPRGNGAVHVVNVASGKCLQVESSSSASGAAVQQGVCDSRPGASFTFADAGEAALLKPLTSSPAKCLEVAGSSLAEGAPLRQWDCNNQAGAAFVQKSVPPQQTTIVNDLTNKCLEIPNGSAVDGTRVTQSTCVPGALRQQWNVVDGSGPAITLSNVQTSKCLQIEGGSVADGARLVQMPCNGSRTQSWLDEPQWDSTYALVNLNSFKYLGIVNDSMANGAEVDQWDNFYGPDEYWRINL